LRFIIREEINNSIKDFRKYIPARYLPAIGKIKDASKVSLVIFPDKIHVVTTGLANKALKRITNKEMPIIWIAWSFSVEAHKVIEDSHGTAIPVGNYSWNEDRWNEVHGGSP